MTTPSERYYPPQKPSFYLRLSVYWFALSLLWGGMISIVIQHIVAQISPDKKDIVLGWTLAVGALVSTVVGLIIGTISDRSRWRMGRRRPYIIVGSIMTVPALLWLGNIGTSVPDIRLIPLLMFDFCLIQFWTNIGTAPYQAFVPDLVKKENQGAASAYMGMGSLVGQLGGLLLCGTLVQYPNGIMTICWTLSIGFLVAMLFTVFTVHEESAVENPSPRMSTWQAMRYSFQVNPREHPDFFWLIASRFVINMGFYTATEFLYYYTHDTLRAANAPKTVLMIMAIATVSGLLGNFPAGIYADRISKKRIVYIAATITGVAIFGFLITSNIIFALVMAFIFGAGYGAFQAVDWALATNLLPDYDEAKFMGIWHAAFTIPQVLAPLIGGTVAYIFNQGFLKSAATSYGPGFGYRVVLFLVIVYLGLGCLVLRPVRERLPHIVGDPQE
ncbi:MFS transporter [Armatimonadota bacterium]|nr:MFS transporter [Armatimonadota bacterium]